MLQVSSNQLQHPKHILLHHRAKIDEKCTKLDLPTIIMMTANMVTPILYNMNLAAD